jgi:hypothetical protein
MKFWASGLRAVEIWLDIGMRRGSLLGHIALTHGDKAAQRSKATIDAAVFAVPPPDLTETSRNAYLSRHQQHPQRITLYRTLAGLTDLKKDYI